MSYFKDPRIPLKSSRTRSDPAVRGSLLSWLSLWRFRRLFLIWNRNFRYFSVSKEVILILKKKVSIIFYNYRGRQIRYFTWWAFRHYIYLFIKWFSNPCLKIPKTHLHAFRANCTWVENEVTPHMDWKIC